jgi:hypothetical protein
MKHALGIESLYARPFWFVMESPNPNHFTHTLRLWSKGKTEIVVPWPVQQKSSSVPVLIIPPKIASDGPTVAIAVQNEIRIFTAK